MLPEKFYEWLLSLAVLIIAWFLRQIIVDFKEYAKKQQVLELEMVKLMDKICSVESAASAALLAQGKLFDMRMENTEKLLTTINNTLQDTQKILTHMDKNQAVSAKSFELFMKLEDRVIKLENA